MNRQIRFVAYGIVVLFVALIAELTYLQVLDAQSLDTNPENFRRIQAQEYAIQRGPIVASDGAILAQSVASPPGDRLKYTRRYSDGPADGLVSGWYSPYLGKSLTESTYNAQLLGQDNPVTLSSLMDRMSGITAGSTVTLTLDSSVQRVAQKALGSQKGAVIALNPRTGAVIASYSNPGYDPNTITSHDAKADLANWNSLLNDKNDPLLPRAFRQTYPPGSTFKIVTVSAALQTGAAKPDDHFPTKSGIPLPGTQGLFLKNFESEACGGTLVESFTESCNWVFAQLALNMGATKMNDMATAYGFDQKVPFPLGAAKSTFPTPAALAKDKPGLAKSGIGQQDVAATPLQIALLSCAIANDGTIMEPQIAKSVQARNGEVVQAFAPRKWTTPVSPQTAATVKGMMIEVVNSGTGKNAALANAQVAGKTGTAEAGPGEQPHAWFTGFAPADNPQVAVAVIVEHGGVGGAVAAPIAHDVMAAALHTS